MKTIFTYGPGIPRYLGLWVVLLPVVVAGLAALRVPATTVVVVVLATLPSLSRNPPWWLGFPLRWFVMTAAAVAVAVWLVARLRPSGADRAPGGATTAPESGVDRRAAAALVLLALCLRVPLAWWDPGISQIGTSTEIAAEQLLDGRNPYPLPNPDADYGTYQYPAGTLLAHAPLVALVPDSVLGERHLGIRATLWLAEALAVVFLAWAGARAGHPRGGLAAAFAYAAGPTLVRESGMSVANDLLLALLAAGAAVALARRRPLAAGALVGLAVAVKPAALVLVPLVLVAAGWRPAAAAVSVPAALQLPFLVWQGAGLRGRRALVEPATRAEELLVLRDSTWYPVYRWLGTGAGVRRAAAAAAVLVAAAAALWAGRQLRRHGPTLGRAAAAVALPLLVAYVLAPVPRTNYQDWYLTAFLLCAGLTARARAPAARPAAVSGRSAATTPEPAPAPLRP